jgi:hypothetical protein
MSIEPRKSILNDLLNLIGIKIAINENNGEKQDVIDEPRASKNFISSIRNSDNKDKGFIPTQISLTIDGIAGWVIGNLFKVDETFIPKYYKRKASKLGYEVSDEDLNLGSPINSPILK